MGLRHKENFSFIKAGRPWVLNNVNLYLHWWEYVANRILNFDQLWVAVLLFVIAHRYHSLIIGRTFVRMPGILKPYSRYSAFFLGYVIIYVEFFTFPYISSNRETGFEGEAGKILLYFFKFDRDESLISWLFLIFSNTLKSKHWL